MKIGIQKNHAWFLVLGICLVGAVAQASASPDTPGQRLAARAQDPPQQGWMKTMEASVEPLALGPESLPSSRSIGGWVGWLLALVLFLALVFLQLRIRRQSEFLLRAGERDHFLIRPAGERRSRPR